MEFEAVQRVRRELWEARTERDRLVNGRHRLQADLVRQGDELRAAQRDLEGTRADLAAAHAELAALRGGAVGAGECGGVVCVNTADPAGLDDGSLSERLVALGGARDRIDGLFAEVAGEFVRRNCREAAAWTMREHLRVSGFRARRDAALAGDLVEHGLTDTVAALRRGEITAGHARLIATEAPQERHMDEADLLELSRDYPVDRCGRAARTAAAMQIHPDDDAAADDAGDAQYRAQREQRRASLRPGEDGMWELTGRFDYLTGRRINQTLQAMIASLRQDAGGSARSYPQRVADALAELITGESNHLRPRTNLLVIADYDAVAGQLANPRLDDGTPISAELLAELAANAKVLPAIFDAKWSNLALGTARNASDMQNLVLAARDGGCISCGAHSEATHAHHIKFWSDDGPTEIPNLASLCPRCHNLIHDHNWEVQVAADGHPKLRPPTHLRLPPEVPGVGDLHQTLRERPPDTPRLPANTPAHTNPVLRT